MDDPWTELPPQFVMAVGRLALAFAALENAISMLISESGTSTKSFETLSGDTFDGKRGKLKALQAIIDRKQGHFSIPIDRIRTLSELRNDLLHGLAFYKREGSGSELITTWNPFRKRAASVTVEALDRITAEIREIVSAAPFLSYDIRNSPDA